MLCAYRNAVVNGKWKTTFHFGFFDIIKKPSCVNFRSGRVTIIDIHQSMNVLIYIVIVTLTVNIQFAKRQILDRKWATFKLTKMNITTTIQQHLQKIQQLICNTLSLLWQYTLTRVICFALRGEYDFYLVYMGYFSSADEISFSFKCVFTDKHLITIESNHWIRGAFQPFIHNLASFSRCARAFFKLI